MIDEIRVAHITATDLSLHYLLLNQLRFLQKKGYIVTGISSPGAETKYLNQTSIRFLPIQITRHPFTPIHDLRALWQLYQTFRRERFTIVHTHTPKPGLLGQLAAKVAGVPVIVNTLHGFYFHERMTPLLRRFYIAIEKIAAACSDVILSQNSEDVETAIQEGICQREKIKFLGNGIDLDRFDPGRMEREKVNRTRADLGIAKNARVVGFVGRLVREKGLLELFAAMRLVSERVPNVILLVVGPVDSEKRDALSSETAREYGIEANCRFTGLRQDMPELYSLMDVFVLPSHREGFPRAPMEASAMGVPSIVTDIRGCRQVVEQGQNGLLVPLGDVNALADAITTLLNDSEIARKMSQAARRIAQERFDERFVFERVQEEYAHLLRNKHIPIPLPQTSVNRTNSL
ncbi:MAG: glycosyltransferase family 4 protein [Chloroflexi bacterium]|nr:glycosyltransferase family 4 protein [Chloroflexota bacterium]